MQPLTPGASPSPQVYVHGGVGGIEARCEDLELLASYGTAFARLLGLIDVRCHQMFMDRRLALSAPLDPLGWLRFERELLAALEGPDGLTALTATMHVRSGALCLAALRYRTVDEARAIAFGVVGAAIGSQPILTVGGAIAGYGIYKAGAAFGVDWLGVVSDQQAQIVGAGDLWPGLVHGLLDPWIPGGAWGAARELARLYPDGRPMVAALGIDEEAGPAPGGFADLFAALARRRGAPSPAGPGQTVCRWCGRPTAPPPTLWTSQGRARGK